MPRYPVTFAMTVDDVGFGDEPDAFVDLDKFFGGLDLPVTYFVTPRWGDVPIYEKPAWLAALRHSAMQPRRAFALHGLRHDTPFEFGWTHPYMGRADHDREWATRRDEVRAGLRRQALQEKLAEGQRIFEHVFGAPAKVFRSPYAAVCEDLWAALLWAGIAADSSKVINWDLWRYWRQEVFPPVDWDPDLPPHLRQADGLWHAPIMAEYSWMLTDNAQVERCFGRALDDFHRVREREDGLFVMVCHVEQTSREFVKGREVIRRLVEVMKQDKNVRFVTLPGLIAEVAR
jgi:hypothetical protein